MGQTFLSASSSGFPARSSNGRLENLPHILRTGFQRTSCFLSARPTGRQRVGLLTCGLVPFLGVSCRARIARRPPVFDVGQIFSRHGGTGSPGFRARLFLYSYSRSHSHSHSELQSGSGSKSRRRFARLESRPNRQTESLPYML